jgi:nicotinate-nucleotide pyrophosphorylase (carboxylating)
VRWRRRRDDDPTTSDRGPDEPAARDGDAEVTTGSAPDVPADAPADVTAPAGSAPDDAPAAPGGAHDAPLWGGGERPPPTATPSVAPAEAPAPDPEPSDDDPVLTDPQPVAPPGTAGAPPAEAPAAPSGVEPATPPVPATAPPEATPTAPRPRGRAGAGPLPGDATLDPAALLSAAREAVRRALAEDLDADGDTTSAATVPADLVGRADLVARADGVVAGTALVREVFDQLDPRVSVELSVADGDAVRTGQHLGQVVGPLRSILTGERTALNFLTHLSGVATRTRDFARAVEGTGCVVRDTRKTTPGLRLLEKAAVRAGGGTNHRIGLFDALLVKDNHVAAAGSVGEATRRALQRGGGRHVQVEVRSVDELEEAVAAGARDVLLDNLSPEDTVEAVAWCRVLEAELDDRVLLESSGRVTLDAVRAYAEAGVDRVAVGGLTHSAPQLDIALDVRTDEVPGG